MIDLNECEHLIGAVATDLADTEPDPTLPTEWCDGWDAAVREHGEPLADQLRLALAEIDRLETERSRSSIGQLGAMAEVDQLRKRCEAVERMLGTERDATMLRSRLHARSAKIDQVVRERDSARRWLITTVRVARLLRGRLSETEAAFQAVRQMRDEAMVELERRDAVVDAAVAWVRAGGTLAALAAAVNAMEDKHG